MRGVVAEVTSLSNISSKTLTLDSNVVDPTYDVSKFMAEPLTPRSTLVKDKDDIKVKMELFIMKIQVFVIGPFL